MATPDNQTYPLIEDYGIIGDGRSAALVSRRGGIDWCCLPDFDSDAVLCRLLDWDKGGTCEVAPPNGTGAERHYLEHTNVLVTTHRTRTGACTVTDFMPAGNPSESGGARICRVIDARDGPIEVRVNVRPTFGFAALDSRIESSSPHEVIARCGRQLLRIGASFPLEIASGAASATVRMRPGDRHVLTLSDEDVAVPAPRVVERLLDQTVAYWRRWTDSLHYEGLYPSQVIRSALTLKLLIYEPTGGVIAAPTTSLPEHIGGHANWDYRFVWLRDASLILDVLQRLHRHEESMCFFGWLERLCACRRLQPVYTIRGDPNLPERELPHLEGYRGSRPVRVGNAAARQVQWDIAGHLLDACRCFERVPRPIDPNFWDFLRQLADRVAQRWREPDESIWETRLGARQFLHSKLFAWVALDRAIKLARMMNLPGDQAAWKRERQAIRTAIIREGFSHRMNSFTAVLGEESLDVAALQIPLVGFLPADDPRVQSTVRCIRKELGRDGMVYRNPRFATGEKDAAFLFSSFWLVDNLALAGQLDDARGLFEQLVAQANDLGLLAEEAAARRHELRGNFPQGFSHLGLIRSALRLKDAQRSEADARRGAAEAPDQAAAGR